MGWRSAPQCRPLVGIYDEVGPAVPLPSGFVMPENKGTLLAITDNGDSIIPYASSHQEVPDRLRPALSQCEIILVGPSLIAVPLDQNSGTRIGPEPPNIVHEGLLGILTKDGFTKVKEHIFHRGLFSRRRPRTPIRPPFDLRCHWDLSNRCRWGDFLLF